MESCSFQSQLLSVMEVLAKAAVAEINRCVDESCAVLRLEVSQSRRDIDLLKSKCEVMEAELRRSRMRARRKVFYPPAAARLPPLVKVVLNKGSQSSHWDTPMETQAPDKPQQCAEDMEPANGADHILIKEECTEEDMWKNDAENRLISGAEHQPCFGASKPTQTDSFAEHYHTAEKPTHSESVVSQTESYSAFPKQQLNSNQNETELLVKHEKEEETDENAAPLTSAHTFVIETAEGQLWSSSMSGETGDPSVSYTEQQFEQIPPAFASPTRLHLEDVAPRIYSVGKLNSVKSVARVKRRARTIGCKRPQSEEGHNTVCQIGSIDPSFISQQLQHHNRDDALHTTNPEDLTGPNPAALFGTHRVSSSSSSLTRRMRTPWRSGLSEKRFSCTYCDKSFTRFSQLKEHLRSHTGEKPFSCMQCGRSFTKQCNLIRHAVVHSGEKPYECSLCGKCFTQRSSLKSHQKTAHL
ncbi:zinc finger protein Xfin [Archocentrus centrarchus]|uniref:zinc finger protein Xfin n=1 Tax=Archocentrus centrarchus TaxID=63155 RepID=UPI0011EA2862|nr:zinc finger protein Xfin-like [Archocentrus centrarchus]